MDCAIFFVRSMKKIEEWTQLFYEYQNRCYIRLVESSPTDYNYEVLGPLIQKINANLPNILYKYFIKISKLIKSDIQMYKFDKIADLYKNVHTRSNPSSYCFLLYEPCRGLYRPNGAFSKPFLRNSRKRNPQRQLSYRVCHIAKSVMIH